MVQGRIGPEPDQAGEQAVSNAGPWIGDFVRLGRFLSQFPAQRLDPELEQLNRKAYGSMEALISQVHVHNPWFTPENVLLALEGIATMLEPEVLEQWLGAYGPELANHDRRLNVGLVMAGNIPLVGFHDLLCVLVAGHKAMVKYSSKDERLLRELVGILLAIHPRWKERVELIDDALKGMDAVIATGSNNSARHFAYYLKDIPHIIRKNRNGVAILNGRESPAQLKALGEDIFSYFGMGCRNVCKVYVPEDYDLKVLMASLDEYASLIQHHKYANNVEYYRTLYLMNRVDFLDNGVVLLKQDPAIASPVGVVYYERYAELSSLVNLLEGRRDEIQVLVSSDEGLVGALPPGQSQQPKPWDYADGVDTLDFLCKLKA